MTLQPGAKKFLFFVVPVLAIFWAFMFGPLNYLIPGRAPTQSVVPKAVRVGNMANNKSNATELPLPSADPSTSGGQPFTMKIMAWNSQFSLLLANGGLMTTQGSLMEKHGVNMTLERLDDCEIMKADLVAFADAVAAGNPYPTDQPAFVAVMGDGAAAFLAGINPTLKKLGDEYVAQVVASAGYSFGEDKLMGPVEWKRNPAAMRGKVISGYLRDGDWNIAMKYLADNGIPNNPDETTYDPTAVNWVAAADFLKAVELYVQDYSEERPIVVNGKKTGQTKKIKIDGVVTWTPGDANLFEQVGQDPSRSLVSIVSTKEYSGQMPNAIIGIRKWMQDNRPLVEGMVQAIGEAGDQVKAFPTAKQKAAEISAVVYAEKDADYWLRYHDGVVEKDVNGNDVHLGGSKPNNLADMVQLFGPAGYFKSTYVSFGNIVVQQYPKLVKSFPPPEEAIDGSYVMAVAARTKTTTATADKYVFKTGNTVLKTVVGKRKYNLQFATGSARLLPGQTDVLEALKDELTISLSLKAVIHGHTDATGTREGNHELSRARARTVQEWLQERYPDVFPSGRLQVVAHGQDQPIGSNDTDEGRAKNRRVEIVTGVE
jgi:outer membrane protein OmpA-like peptidoglycan-associated protein